MEKQPPKDTRDPGGHVMSSSRLVLYQSHVNCRPVSPRHYPSKMRGSLLYWAALSESSSYRHIKLCLLSLLPSGISHTISILFHSICLPVVVLGSAEQKRGCGGGGVVLLLLLCYRWLSHFAESFHPSFCPASRFPKTKWWYKPFLLSPPPFLSYRFSFQDELKRTMALILIFLWWGRADFFLTRFQRFGRHFT